MQGAIQVHISISLKAPKNTEQMEAEPPASRSVLGLTAAILLHWHDVCKWLAHQNPAKKHTVSTFPQQYP